MRPFSGRGRPTYMRYWLCCLIAFSTLTAAPPASTDLVQAKKTDSGFFCYWMENVSGRFEWVPAEVGGLYHGEGYDQCFALDSCDGGEGQSGGGCYKWARSASAARVLWTKVKPAKRN